MNLLHWLLDLLHTYSQTASLELLAFFVAIVQEIVAPIPSFPLLATIGYLARLQEYHPIGIFYIALFSAAGKTLAGVAYYYLADKTEDIASLKFGKYFNVKPGQLEAIGERFKDSFVHYLLLIILRAIPFLSSTLITIVAGLLKIPFKLFVISMYIGSFIQDSIYIYVGYTGVKLVKDHLYRFHELKSYLVWFFIAIIISLLIIFFVRQVASRWR